MFDRIGNGWELVKSSWRVLLMDKELLIFPLLSGISCLMVLASFAVPLYRTHYVQSLIDQGQAPQDVWAYVILFAFYCVNYFVIVFFNTALVACAMIRFQGGNPGLRDGLRAAGARLPQIAAWALVSATVGLVLRTIESRSSKVGQFVAALLGGAWTIATYFVVPVLVVERSGPLTAFQRSLAILRRSWGESLAANFSVGFVTVLCMLVALVPLALGIFALASGQMVLGAIGVVVGVLSILVANLVSSALNSILLAALYWFATKGEVPLQFSAQSLRNAFASPRR